MEAITDFFINIFDNMVKYAKTIRITDILDVAVISFVCYKLLRLIRRTNTVRVLKAILLLLVVLGLATLLRLNVVSFLMSKVLELGFLALVVVFQPELRRLLEQVGSSRFSDIFKISDNNDMLEETIRQSVIAAEELAKRREGALIVFERKIKLDDVLKTGTMLEADTSSELLRNIFYPKAPLHDGAAIIRGSKIAGAGCMLPLSGNANLSRDLGMRHRAGIGVSEHTDAIAVIVSEESGAISVAVGGMLKRRLTPDTLERLLSSELLPPQEGDSTRISSLFSGLFKGKKNEKKED